MLPQKKRPGECPGLLVPALVMRADDYVAFTDARRNGTRPMMGRQQVHLVPGRVENICIEITALTRPRQPLRTRPGGFAPPDPPSPSLAGGPLPRFRLR